MLLFFYCLRHCLNIIQKLPKIVLSANTPHAATTATMAISGKMLRALPFCVAVAPRNCVEPVAEAAADEGVLPGFVVDLFFFGALDKLVDQGAGRRAVLCFGE